MASLVTPQVGNPPVKGKCPACGGYSLFLGSYGYVTCANLRCPDPCAASDKLEATRQTFRLPVGVGLTTKENTMFDFGVALNELRAGHRVSRAGWNGPGQYLELQRPDENSKMTLPYVYIRTVQGDFVPWLASQTDMLAEDWYRV